MPDDKQTEDEDRDTSAQVHVQQIIAQHLAGAYLLVVSGKGSVGKIFKVKGEMIIGRGRADIPLPDTAVSRRHAKVKLRDDGSVELIDLGSRNGIFSEGVRIDSKVLRDGDKVHIGGVAIVKLSSDDAIDELQKNLYESATRDALTTLYNRDFFLDVLGREFAHANHQLVPLSLVLLEIDNLQQIIEAHGYETGNRILQRLARWLREFVRFEDVVARYSSEQFSIMLPETSEKDASAWAEKIRQEVETTEYSCVLPVTASVGVATLQGGNYENVERMLAAVERYLGSARESGRNRVVEARLKAVT
jgi:diguanylate cyclase (GGDEF)-like protein